MHTIYIITVCRNAESIIEETVKSVLSQTYSNVKYLIIDGASTDGTVDIIKKYSDKLTYWQSEPDKGIYDAMNKGLEKAREFGDGYVNFMNAGDTFADDNVIEQIFGKNEVDADNLVVGGHTNLVYENKIEILYAQSPKEVNHKLPYCHQSTFVKLFLNNDIWRFDTNLKIAADYKIFYDIYFKFGAEVYKSVDVIVANYRMEDSMTFSNLRKAKGEYLKVQSGHRDWQWWKEYIKWRCL